MGNLLKTQQQLGEMLSKPNASDIEFISSDYPMERLEIYRHTVISNLSGALSITFPGIWRLLGDDCAKKLAIQFSSSIENWPQEGYLHNWGKKFAAFLQEQDSLIKFPYLKDYALYEFYRYQSYCAESVPALDMNYIHRLTELPQSAVKVQLHPSVFLYSSPYTINLIEEATQNSSALEWFEEDVYGLIVRDNFEVRTFWLSSDIWNIINHLHKHGELYSTLEYMESTNSALDLVQLFVFLFKNRLVYKMEV